MSAVAEKPSLHEIAAMPFPASQEAMRKHYNPHWGKDVPDDGEKRRYKVKVRWIAEGSETYEVEAFSEDEAEELAGEEFDSDGCIPDDAEWDDCTITELTSEQVS